MRIDKRDGVINGESCFGRPHNPVARELADAVPADAAVERHGFQVIRHLKRLGTQLCRCQYAYISTSKSSTLELVKQVYLVAVVLITVEDDDR